MEFEYWSAFPIEEIDLDKSLHNPAELLLAWRVSPAVHQRWLDRGLSDVEVAIAVVAPERVQASRWAGHRFQHCGRVSVFLDLRALRVASALPRFDRTRPR